MDPSETLGPEVFIEELMSLLGQALTKMEVSEHYETIRELGRGTYGSVQLVRHRVQGTLMALKLMDKRTTRVRCFLREYSVGLFLSPHPFISTALGIAFESQGYYAFLQEYAPIGDLFDLIRPMEGIPEPAAKRCSLQLSLALDHLHSRGLVHRDVKPDNVLLFDAECRRVKLADFGLARPAGLALGPRCESDLRPSSPPELSGQEPRVGCPEDAWALGVLIYGLLTGQFPWENAGPTDRLYRAFMAWQEGPEDRPPPLGWARLAPAARSMLRGLLAIRPEDRSMVKAVLGYLKQPWLEGVGEGSQPRVEEGVGSPKLGLVGS
ncbi:serine/threonine-protein kinase SBK1-like isoform X2 [Narcine bancroftii]